MTGIPVPGAETQLPVADIITRDYGGNEGYDFKIDEVTIPVGALGAANKVLENLVADDSKHFGGNRAAEELLSTVEYATVMNGRDQEVDRSIRLNRREHGDTVVRAAAIALRDAVELTPRTLSLNDREALWSAERPK